MKTERRSLIPWLLYAICAIAWLILSLRVMAPEFGSGDVYLFRDAASNYLLGHGFSTFAVERQTSFRPHIYSSYTPGLQWLYIGFAGIFGNTPRSESAFVLVWSYMLDAVFFAIGLRFAGKNWIRALFFGLLALLFPLAGLAIMPDRPEYVSLLLLTGVLYLLSRPFRWKEAIFIGTLSCAAFLVEPIAGVFALFFVIGASCASKFRLANEAPLNAVSFSLPKIALTVVLFAAGISLSAAIYAHIDPQSLHRFNEQARMGGLQRTLASRQGDFDWPPQPEGSASQARQIPRGKIWDILLSLTAGRITLCVSLGYFCCLFLFFRMMARSEGPFIGRVPLMALGIVCLILPLVLFPLQENYRMMAVPLMALALAFDWAGTRTAAAMKHAPVLLLLLFFAGCAPAVVAGYAVRFENRSTYRAAVAQSMLLRSYLNQRIGTHGGVFIVPDSHYYLYKNVLGEMTTPRYLTAMEDPSLVAGVVNCYAGTLFFGPAVLPLPELVHGQSFHRILSERSDVPFSLPMLRGKVNETWECDVYVRD